MLNMLFHSIFQGVHVGQMPYLPLNGKTPRFSGESLAEECTLPSQERGRQDQMLIVYFSVSDSSGRNTPLQRLIAEHRNW